MAFPLTVNLSYGMEKVETSEQKHILGTRGTLPDGRVFYYAENSGTAIDHGGYLVDGIAAVAKVMNDEEEIEDINDIEFTGDTIK